jgi:hypothetical protein
VASRVSPPPQIDGVLREREWELAVPVSGFLQYDPEEGSPATEETLVRVLYDGAALYFGVLCRDSDPRRVVRQLSRRDRSAEADRFTITIDSYHDHQTAFVFSGTVSGVQSDGLISQAGRTYDVQWDAVWDYAARVTREGWSAEFRIPFTSLRFNPEDEMVWGINFRRYIARKGETVEWVMVPRSETGSVAKMGHLSGLKGVRPPSQLALRPYVVSEAKFEPQPSPFPVKRALEANAGFDLKWGVTNEFTLDAAVNPDFGQVEVDRAIINLTVFETLYPEKRPFFLEGNQMFTFGEMYDRSSLQLFYSRRIGQRPTLRLSPPPGYAYAENPGATRILGAVKFTGKTPNGLTVGGLSALTDREYVSFKDIDGNRTERQRVEPRGSYNVARLRKDILENSSVGLMATSAFKEDYGPAYSGGIDWNLRFLRNTHLVEGYIAASQVTNSAGRQLHGTAGKIFLGKVAGEHLLAVTMYDYASKKFWINALGFFNKPREHGGVTQIIVKNDRVNKAAIRRFNVSGQTDYRWNYDRVNTLNNLELQGTLEYTNFWYSILTYQHDFPAHDDANRGIIGLYRRPRVDTYQLSVTTDMRKPVQAELLGGYSKSAKGGTSWLGSLKLTIRPTAATELTPGISVLSSRNEEAWVYSPAAGFGSTIYDPNIGPAPFSLYADRDYDEVDLSLRGIVAFTPKITLQFFGQVLLDKARFVDFRRLAGPRELVPYDFASSPRYVDPDFNEKTMNANVVLRWEYLPGSTLYFVWTHYRYGNSGIFSRGLRQNFSDAFGLPADNLLLLKVSYWWNL